MRSFQCKADDVNGKMYFQRERKVVDENMLKYNEDDVNYANLERCVFEVGIM